MPSDALPGSPLSVRLVSASFWPYTGSPMGHLLSVRRRLLAVVDTLGVRLALLHRAQWLVMWVEGAPEAVEASWQRIQRMPELEANRILHRSTGVPMLREPVHIASVFRREAPQQVARQLAALAALPPEHTEPARLWQELVTPTPLALSATVVLASAQEHDGIDLLRQLAQGHGSDVVYQRFAGSDPTQIDSGAAYTDIPAGGERTTRLHVLSRRSLAFEPVRRGLTGVGEIVLLLGGREAAATRLAESVLPLIAGCAAPVRVRLVGRESTVLALAENVLRAEAPAAILETCVVRATYEEMQVLSRALGEPEQPASAFATGWGRVGLALAA